MHPIALQPPGRTAPPLKSRRAPFALRLGSALFLATLASCGGGSGLQTDVVLTASESTLPDEWAFHRLGSNDGVIDCTAEIDAAPTNRFGFDISRELDVVPVLLIVNLVGDGTPVRLAEESLQPVLFLENGITLGPAKSSELREEIDEKYVAQFDASVFRSTLLQRAGNSQSRHAGYLFFQIPEGSQYHDGILDVVGANGEGYAARLGRSILQLSYTAGTGADKETATINVGTK